MPKFPFKSKMIRLTLLIVALGFIQSCVAPHKAHVVVVPPHGPAFPHIVKPPIP